MPKRNKTIDPDMAAELQHGLYPFQKEGVEYLSKGGKSDMSRLQAIKKLNTSQMIDRNIEKAKRLAGRRVRSKGKLFIAEVCPGCNGKRLVDVGRPDVQCPVCYRREGRALGIVLVSLSR